MSTGPLQTVLSIAHRAIVWLEALQPLALLAARLFVAQAFFASGLTKLRDWETTLALFSDEYHVPLTYGIMPFVCPSTDTFCQHTMSTAGVFAIDDARADPRFSDIGWVDGNGQVELAEA